MKERLRRIIWAASYERRNISLLKQNHLTGSNESRAFKQYHLRKSKDLFLRQKVINRAAKNYLIDDGVFASLRSQSSFATLTHEILFFQYQLPKKQLKNLFDAESESNEETIHTKKQSSQLNHIINHIQQILYCGSDCRHTYAISSTRVSVISMFCV